MSKGLVERLEAKARVAKYQGNHDTHALCVDAIAEITELEAALRMLYDETMDYIKINNLSAENNQSLVLARAALARAEGGKDE